MVLAIRKTARTNKSAASAIDRFFSLEGANCPGGRCLARVWSTLTRDEGDFISEHRMREQAVNANEGVAESGVDNAAEPVAHAIRNGLVNPQ